MCPSYFLRMLWEVSLDVAKYFAGCWLCCDELLSIYLLQIIDNEKRGFYCVRAYQRQIDIAVI